MNSKQSRLGRLISETRPKFLILIGLFTSILHGCAMPVLGTLMAYMFFTLLSSGETEIFREEANKWAGYMFTLAFASFFTFHGGFLA